MDSSFVRGMILGTILAIVGSSIGIVFAAVVLGGGRSTPMRDTFSSYVEALNEGRYDDALELVDGDCLDYLADEPGPLDETLQYNVLMAAEGEVAVMMALDDSQFGLTWQLMTKVDGDWKVACEVPW